MKRTFTNLGSDKLSGENENELIKLAGFLENEELEAVEMYLKSLQSDVNDEVVRRIVDFSKNFNRANPAKENVAF